jgi:hypothetical protein
MNININQSRKQNPPWNKKNFGCSIWILL